MYKKKGFTLVELLVVVAIVGTLFLIVLGTSYKFISQKTFLGTVSACSEMSSTVVNAKSIPSGTFSFAVDMIVPNKEEILTFSAEDRKFANVVKGDSVKIKVFTYAPWNLGKAGTYYGGRLLKKYKKD